MTEHFIIAGAQRCGTTGVHQLLAQHPDICMALPLRPEPKFFLDQNAVDQGYQEYIRRHFAHRNNEPVLGEKSTSYIERTDAIPRIHKILPETKLVFVLRNPVMRAYSNWRFSRKHGLETLDFDAALRAEEERLARYESDEVSVNPFAYVQRGHYVRYLEQWTRYFEPKRFILLVSEQIFENAEYIRNVYEHLGVRSDCELKNVGRINASPNSEESNPPYPIAKRLRAIFAPTIIELGERWNVDVSSWL